MDNPNVNENIKVAFDLDGVICPDVHLGINWSSVDPTDLQRMFEIRMGLSPIFIPKQQFVVITGRPIDDAQHTSEWFKKYELKPTAIFMNSKENLTVDGVINHKVLTLNKISENFPNMHLYVESDYNQVIQIQQSVRSSIRIVHFSQFIAERINESCY